MSESERIIKTGAGDITEQSFEKLKKYNLRFRDHGKNESHVDSILGNLKQELNFEQKLDLLVFLAQHDEIFNDKEDILIGDEGEGVGELVEQWSGKNIVQE